MRIHSKDFRVREGDEVNLKTWPTKVDPVYKSKEQYQKLLEEHIAQLSSQQQLLYASNRHAVLLIFQATERREKTAPSGTSCPGSTPKAAKCSASNIPAPPNWNTTFYGAPPAICRSAGGSASSTDPIMRRY